MKVKNESYSKGELNAKAELLMMGFVQQITNINNIRYIIDYVSKVLHESITADEVIENAYKYISNKDKIHIVGLSINTIMEEMICLTLILKDDEDGLFNIEDPDGVFCYCYNYTYPDYSELGYSYFRRDNGKLHRIA